MLMVQYSIHLRHNLEVAVKQVFVNKKHRVKKLVPFVLSTLTCCKPTANDPSIPI